MGVLGREAAPHDQGRAGREGRLEAGDLRRVGGAAGGDAREHHRVGALPQGEVRRLDQRERRLEQGVVLGVHAREQRHPRLEAEAGPPGAHVGPVHPDLERRHVGVAVVGAHRVAEHVEPHEPRPADGRHRQPRAVVVGEHVEADREGRGGHHPARDHGQGRHGVGRHERPRALVLPVLEQHGVGAPLLEGAHVGQGRRAHGVEVGALLPRQPAEVHHSDQRLAGAPGQLHAGHALLPQNRSGIQGRGPANSRAAVASAAGEPSSRPAAARRAGVRCPL